MDAAFSSIAFAEPARAESNLGLIEQRLPGNLWATLPALLAQVPDPDGALNFLERYARGASDAVIDYVAQHPAALHYLLVIFSYSRFLSETLVQQPTLILWLHRAAPREEIERMKTLEDLHEEFAQFEAVSLSQPPAVILARYKRREYLRIMLRDVLGIATLAETTMELSHLADVLLQRALRACEQKLENSYGAPQHVDAAGNRHASKMAILALGKLGAEELNYNSDIDLMFLYSHEGETAGGTAGSISNAEFFVRLAQAVLKLVTEVTPEGAAFRVDLRLRPQGGEGDVAVGLGAALDYYRQRGRQWEFQMLIKGRCAAGDADLCRQFLRAVHPMVFPRDPRTLTQDAFAAIEAVLNARQEITRELQKREGRKAAHAAKWNVKLSPGGIRDIEFAAQCLQRVHGGHDMWLAAPAAAPTLVALQRLHDKAYLTGRDFFRLATAYQFLRRVEHRLQLRDGLQRHTLPEGADALERLARRCGIEPAASRNAREHLLSRISQHFLEVREIYERIVQPRKAEDAEGAPAVPEDEPGESALTRRLRQSFPAVAESFAAALAGGDAYARRGMQRFLSSAMLDAACMKMLEANPVWLARAADVFSRSDLTVEMLARNPDEARVLADAGVADIGSPLVTAEDNEQKLRENYRRRVLAIVVRAVLGASQPFETFATLTRLADEALAGALRISAREILGSDVQVESAPFSAIALGRLGTNEMDVGSDADLIFVVDETLTAEEREPWRRLAERFVQLVSSYTQEGLLFPVDTRLRPRGGEGDLLQSAAYLREYFSGDALAWEALAFLKSRPVAGNAALATVAIARTQEIIFARFGKAENFAAQLARTRKLLEKAKDTERPKGEFKKIAGGYYDIEYMVGFLFLTRGIAPVAGHVLRQIAALESAGALDTANARTLREAALLYRSIDHAIRMVTGRSANRLPEPALAGRIGRLLAAWKVPVKGDLEELIVSTREHVRELYQKVIRD
jgi:[glutamine synthetase] adenylyltransferase / [glutamine synthetase]-adenylyl-L-tyrosine phosphorylase